MLFRSPYAFPSIIFSGHMDTVFETGTFGENPFKIIEGKAYGPGVLDMKGGIIISLYVIKALNKIIEKSAMRKTAKYNIS